MELYNHRLDKILNYLQSYKTMVRGKRDNYLIDYRAELIISRRFRLAMYHRWDRVENLSFPSFGLGILLGVNGT